MYKKLLLSAAFSSLFMLQPTYAQNTCKADFQKFCISHVPDKAKIYQCMKDNIANLSPDCQRAMIAFRSCRTDYQKFCSDIKPGEGRIYNCIVQHKNRLSKDCAAAIKKVEK